MTSKPVVLRTTAEREAQAAVDYHEDEAGAGVALDFVAAYSATLRWIGAYPSAGSPRYAEAVDMPGLRSRALGRFPYVVVYVEGAGQVDVLHVLHLHRDIPAILKRDHVQP